MITIVHKAVIMAGGFGTRLRPLTMDLPKPMVPIANTPVMEHIIRLLSKHGMCDILAVLYFHPDTITDYFGDGTRFNVAMSYIMANADYGTAGSIKNAEEYLGEGRFLVISGDVLTDFDLSRALEFHCERNAKATIILTRVPNPRPYGIVMTDAEGRITRFLEKPGWGEVFSDTINTGIYILESEVLKLIPSKQEYDFGKDLFPLMLAENERLFGYIAPGYWRDIGNLYEYQQAHFDVLSGKVTVTLPSRHEGNLWLGTDCRIGKNVTFRGSVVIGDRTTIEDCAVIEDSIIGRDCRIEYGASIVRSVLWDRVHIGQGCILDADVLASDVVVHNHAAIMENTFIAQGCTIGERATLQANIKLWPGKVVEPYAIVTRSMVHEQTLTQELFTDARISGESNVEMNPEFAARVGEAIGTALPVGAAVVVSRDPDPTSRMIKRAIIAGILSTGISVEDLQTTPIPQTRLATRSRSATAGIHVRRSFRNPRLTDIVMIGSDGRDLTVEMAKKIERYFYGEDIRRVRYDRVGLISFPERQNEAYVESYLRALNIDLIARRRFRVLIDYSYGMATLIFPEVLGRLNCTAIALNSYIDPYRASTTGADEENRKEISGIMRSLGYEIGFKIDPGAERIALVDGRGYWFSSMRLLTIVTKLYLESNKNRVPFTIAVPVEATMEIEQIAKEYGVEVVRTKNSHAAMMDATRDDRIRFVGGTRGGFIFPEYGVATDGLYTIGKILEMLAQTGYVLAELDSTLPKRYQSRQSVICPWHKKGTVMRYAMEWSESYQRQLIDGIKVFFEDGRTLLLAPTKERGEFTIVAEASDMTEAESLGKEFALRIQEWRDTE